MKKRILIVAFVLLGVASVLSGCSLNNTANPTSPTGEATEVLQIRAISLIGEDGKSVYDLLKAKYQVEASDSSFGVMIKSVNGLSATDKEFWLYSVNGKAGEVAADKYITKTGDEIVWSYSGA